MFVFDVIINNISLSKTTPPYITLLHTLEVLIFQFRCIKPYGSKCYARSSYTVNEKWFFMTILHGLTYTVYPRLFLKRNEAGHIYMVSIVYKWKRFLSRLVLTTLVLVLSLSLSYLALCLCWLGLSVFPSLLLSSPIFMHVFFVFVSPLLTYFVSKP